MQSININNNLKSKAKVASKVSTTNKINIKEGPTTEKQKKPHKILDNQFNKSYSSATFIQIESNRNDSGKY